MANDIAGRPWRIDTQSASPIANWWINVDHFEMSGYTGATDNVTLKDQNGRVVWQAEAAADKEEVRSGRVGWINGLIPAVISLTGAGAIVLVYIK